ncbi:MAG: hypothetical protein PHV68_02345 [Candidatus Gastranaerophilales bacterium]|nr:hypothetical protein [Candidatus Gastranaerophilales bacterium]
MKLLPVNKQYKYNNQALNKVSFEGKIPYYAKEFSILADEVKSFDKFLFRVAEITKVEDWTKAAIKEKKIKPGVIKTSLNNFFNSIKKIFNENAEIKKSGKEMESGYDKLKFWSLPATSFALSGTHMITTAISDKIPKEDKMPLILNVATCLTIATVGYFTVDQIMKKGTKAFGKYVENIYKEKDKLYNKKIEDGIDSLVKIVTVLGIYKYASAVVAVPIADKLTKFIRGEKEQNNNSLQK